MLPESRLYSFLDSKNNFAIYFLEGQKLFHDLVLLSHIQGEGLLYYREAVLSAQQLINFLKNGENLGFYIDSEDPYIRFKMETNYAGHTRILLIPQDLNIFPKTLNGLCRVAKIIEGGRPYTTNIELKNTPTKELVNKVLKESYQFSSEIIISETADQSLLVSCLPENPDKISEQLSIKEYMLQNKKLFNDFLNKNLIDLKEISEFFEKNNFLYLGSKEIKFFCPCSKERMMINLLNLQNHDFKEIFHDQAAVEINCDYCKKVYHITYEELLKLN
jgi:molecular chaperone Hsp33